MHGLLFFHLISLNIFSLIYMLTRVGMKFKKRGKAAILLLEKCFKLLNAFTTISLAVNVSNSQYQGLAGKLEQLRTATRKYERIANLASLKNQRFARLFEMLRFYQLRNVANCYANRTHYQGFVRGKEPCVTLCALTLGRYDEMMRTAKKVANEIAPEIAIPLF